MSSELFLSPGRVLLHYRLVELIGEGGMGKVWKALDTTLERYVALKVLPTSLAHDPDRLDRFEREARLLASLNHPNVAVVYGMHEAESVRFLAMEFVAGEDLSARLKRGPLPLSAALKTGAQVAAALEATHARGIVHRDLKPANIRITPADSVKVLDFGIAKALLRDMPAETTTVAARTGGVTEIGMVVGTPAYMSPEQADGIPVDARADVWAFACVLYEALTGVRAFGAIGRSPLLSAAERNHPDWGALPVATPPSVRELLRRCLTRDVERRLADIGAAREVIESALAGLSDAAAPVAGVHSRKSVAVLPFVNMSTDLENQFFSDGLAEDLINALTRLPALHVASRTSTFRFRDSNLDVRQIGEHLAVGAVVEGSVRRAGKRLRVTAQLIDVSSGYHLWSERYDREVADVFDIQDDIVASIVKALEPALLGESKKAVRRPTENVEAYELYLQGRHYWHQRSPGTLHLAIQHFERAIALEPGFALAFAGLADCYGLLRTYGWVSASDSRPRALEAVTRAAELDPGLAEVRYSQGFFTLCFERAWRQAEPYFKDALAINPRSSLARVYYGLYLAARYRFDEGVSQIEKARDQDPLSPFVHAMSALAMYVSLRFDEAEAGARRSLELQPDYLLGLWVLGMALCGRDRADDAVVSLERLVAFSRAPIFVGMLGFAYARVGRPEDAGRLLNELDERRSRGEYVIPLAQLAIFMGLSDVPALRRALESCIADTTPVQPVRTVLGPFLDRFRHDPEIDRMLERYYDGARPQ
jgi:serine/threonine protein kinase/Flp pilus assembly protein TadD